jgi:hypothetical protein
MGTTQMGKSPAIPPPIWKNPTGVEESAIEIPLREHLELIRPRPHGGVGCDVAGNDM